MENNPFDIPGQVPQNQPSIIPEPHKENKFLGFIRSLLVFLVLALIVIASFWVSLQLGKRILSPGKKFDEERIKVSIPEPPPSIKKLQELGINVSGEAKAHLEKAFAAAKPAAKKVPIREMKRTKVVKPARAGQQYYYKVQAGVFADKSAAQELGEKMKSAGISIFIKKVSAGYRVQAGAYKTRTSAAKMQSTLKQKGFDSTMIREWN